MIAFGLAWFGYVKLVRSSGLRERERRAAYKRGPGDGEKRGKPIQLAKAALKALNSIAFRFWELSWLLTHSTMTPLFSLALLTASLSGLARADTCSTVAETSSIDVKYPISPAYSIEQSDYWSSSCAALKPTCIMFPKSAEEVAVIIKVLNDNGETFAIKSGGHNPNNYFSSVQGGPLISTQKLDQVLLDRETGIARVGPGIRLDEIAAQLQGTGWTFVGGRIGNTGV